MFCTVINCMDGRTQIPAIQFLKKRFNAEYVDSITEPGPNLILGEQTEPETIKSIFRRIKISVEHHHSVGIAVVGHHDCAGNPSPQEGQIGQIKDSIALIRQQYSNIEIIGLWVDKNWQVTELT